MADVAKLQVVFDADKSAWDRAFTEAKKDLKTFTTEANRQKDVELGVDKKGFERGLKDARSELSTYKKDADRNSRVALSADTSRFTSALRGASGALRGFKQSVRRDGSMTIEADPSAFTKALAGARGALRGFKDEVKKSGNLTIEGDSSSFEKAMGRARSSLADFKRDANQKVTLDVEQRGGPATEAVLKTVQRAANRLDGKHINVLIGGAATIASGIATQKAIEAIGNRVNLLQRSMQALGAVRLDLIFGAVPAVTGTVLGLTTAVGALAAGIGEGLAGALTVVGPAFAGAALGLTAYGQGIAYVVGSAGSLQKNLLTAKSAVDSAATAVDTARKAVKQAKPGTEAYAQAQARLATATEQLSQAQAEYNRQQILNTPAAQAFARQLQDTHTALVRLQAAVGSRVFPVFTRELSAWTNLLPRFQDDIATTAGTFAAAGAKFSKFLRTAQDGRLLGSILDFINNSAIRAANTLQEFGQAGLLIFQQLIPGATRFQTRVEHLAIALRKWTQDAQNMKVLDGVFASLEDRFYQLTDKVADFGAGLFNVFRAAGANNLTDRMMHGLAGIAENFREATANSQAFKDEIRFFGNQGYGLLGRLGGITGELSSNLVRISHAALDFRTEGSKLTVVQQIFEALKDSIRPVADMLLTTFREVGPELPSLIRNLAQVLETFGGYTPVLKFYLRTLNSILGAFNSLPTPIKTATASLAAFAAISGQLGGGGGAIASMVGSLLMFRKLGGIKGEIGVVASKLDAVALAAGGAGSKLEVAATTAAASSGRFGRLGSMVGGAARSVGKLSLLLAGGIGLGALAVAFGAAYAKSDKFREAVNGIARSLGDKFKRVADEAGDALLDIFDFDKKARGKASNYGVRGAHQFATKYAEQLRKEANNQDSEGSAGYEFGFKIGSGIRKGVNSLFRHDGSFKWGKLLRLGEMPKGPSPIKFGSDIGEGVRKGLAGANWSGVTTKKWHQIAGEGNKTWSSIANNIGKHSREGAERAEGQNRSLQATLGRIWDKVQTNADNSWSSTANKIAQKNQEAKEKGGARQRELEANLGNIWKRILNSSATPLWAKIAMRVIENATEAKEKGSARQRELESNSKSIWSRILDGANQRWPQISGAIWHPIETARNKVQGFMNSLIGIVNVTLRAFGQKPISTGGGGNPGGSRNDDSVAPNQMGRARGGVDSGTYRDTRGRTIVYMAEGGTRQGPTGGIADGSRPRVVYGEAGPEAYVTLGRYTKESAEALMKANETWERRGWFSRMHGGKPSPESLHHHARGGLEGTRRMALGGYVDYGSVSERRWNNLMARGWRGDPTDSHERLYRPSHFSGGSSGSGVKGSIGIRMYGRGGLYGEPVYMQSGGIYNVSSSNVVPWLWNMNQDVEGRFGVNGTTYAGHGAQGNSRTSVDWLVSQGGWGTVAAGAAKEKGDAIVSYIGDKFKQILQYVIWFGRANYSGKGGGGWQPYRGGGGYAPPNPNDPSAMHEDHVHASVTPSGQSGGYNGAAAGGGFSGGPSLADRIWNGTGGSPSGWKGQLLGAVANFLPGLGLIGKAANAYPGLEKLIPDKAPGFGAGVIGAAAQAFLSGAKDWAHDWIYKKFGDSGGGLSGGGGAGMTMREVLEQGWPNKAEHEHAGAIAYRESRFDIDAKNPASTAYGLFQFLKTTAEGIGADYNRLGKDPVYAASAAYKLKQQMGWSPWVTNAGWQGYTGHLDERVHYAKGGLTKHLPVSMPSRIERAFIAVADTLRSFTKDGKGLMGAERGMGQVTRGPVQIAGEAGPEAIVPLTRRTPEGMHALRTANRVHRFASGGISWRQGWGDVRDDELVVSNHSKFGAELGRAVSAWNRAGAVRIRIGAGGVDFSEAPMRPLLGGLSGPGWTRINSLLIPGSRRAQGVVSHELGHHLWLNHMAGGVMSGLSPDGYPTQQNLSELRRLFGSNFDPSSGHGSEGAGGHSAWLPGGSVNRNVIRMSGGGSASTYSRQGSAHAGGGVARTARAYAGHGTARTARATASSSGAEMLSNGRRSASANEDAARTLRRMERILDELDIRIGHEVREGMNRNFEHGLATARHMDRGEAIRASRRESGGALIARAR